MLWFVVLLGHAAGFLFSAHGAPRGFPPGHVKFWANEVLPWVTVLCCGGGAFAAVAGRVRRLRPLASGTVGFWVAVALASRVFFPQSMATLWAFPLAIALLLGGPLVPLWLGSERAPRRVARSAVAVLAACPMALLAVGALRAPAADTRPAAVEAAPFEPSTEPTPGLVDLDGAAWVETARGLTRVSCGRLVLDLAPLLEFESRSPDGAPTVLAGGGTAVPMRLAAWRREPGRLLLRFDGDAARQLAVRRSVDGVEVDAFADLPAVVYSHLNQFASFTVHGAERPELAFSPCGAQAFEVLPMGYPSGLPERQAHLDAEGVFRVTEASDAEKGPFRTLATGRLAPSEPLAITVLDAGRPQCRIEFADWAAQAGRALSPTAGWGLPVNAIEFARDLGGRGAARVWITLAATSVGRGWDSVGHAAGRYRNRIRIVSLERVGDGGRAPPMIDLSTASGDEALP